MQMRSRILRGSILLLVCLGALPALSSAGADGAPAWQAAAQVRDALFSAQRALLAGDLFAAEVHRSEAEGIYQASALSGTFAEQSADLDSQIKRYFDEAGIAVEAGDLAALSLRKGQIWSAFLEGAYRATLAALEAGDAATARKWLLLREYRQTTRFSRPDADATLAVTALANGESTAEEAAGYYRADLLDTYQANLARTLDEIQQAGELGFDYRQEESVGHILGYWRILRPAYVDQVGAEAAIEADQVFQSLLEIDLGSGGESEIATITQIMNSFRAAPLTEDEQARRAGQMLRFLSLVPIEYRRGVRNGEVTLDIEIQEAITFLDGAQAAFTDLRLVLDELDASAAQGMQGQMAEVEEYLRQASQRTQVVDPDVIEEGIAAVSDGLETMLPEEWLASNTDSDLDVVASVLDQMIAAVSQGQYPQAESARLEAYAIFDTGLEPRLLAFAPDMVALIDGLFWQGYQGQMGLGNAIALQASRSEVVAIRGVLDDALEEARQILGEGPAATPVIITNAAVIVFREGLEAVIIIAALIAGMVGAYAHYRRPLAVGAILALIATVATWWVAQGILLQFRGFGERLEAVVSLIAIVVLLLVTNWFFHRTYWTGWLASFQKKKSGLLNAEAGQILGLIALGFSSIYREGFETVLFLQALVLDAGSAVVLQGVALGLVGVAIIGYMIFRLQSRLPYMRLLIATGILIGAVLLVLVGKTVHVMQAVAWMPISPIAGLELPYWLGLWFGVFPTWQGIGAQLLSVLFVVGSYYLAEYQRKRRRLERSRGGAEASTAEPG